MGESGGRRQAQRWRLYVQQGGRCYWCNVEVVLPRGHEKHPPSNQATIDHLDSRFSSERGKHAGKPRRVLACWECNQRRCHAEQTATPLPELWRRARSYPRGLGDKNEPPYRRGPV